jgi:hypothetical protein
MNPNNRPTANRTLQLPVRKHIARKIRTKSVQIRPFSQNAVCNQLHINNLSLHCVIVYGFFASANSPARYHVPELTGTDQNRPIFRRPVTHDVRRGLTAASSMHCTKWDNTGRFSKTQNPDRCALGTYADAQRDRPIFWCASGKPSEGGPVARSQTE